MKKYLPLHLALRNSFVDRVGYDFDTIEGMVGGLPSSAGTYRAWWANDRTHSQALSWLDAGFVVDSVVLGKRVEIVRAG